MRRAGNSWFAVAALAAVVMLGGCSPGSSQDTGGDIGQTAQPADAGGQVAGQAAPASAPAREPTLGEKLKAMVSKPEYTVPEGTMLSARLIPTLSTKTHEVGDSFEATLTESLIADGHVVAPAGASVRGTVVEADKGGRVEGRARIAVQLTELSTAGGRTVEIATDSVGRAAPTTKKKDAEKIGIGAGIGAAIGAIAGGGKGAAIGAAAGGGAGSGAVLATRGAPAEIPSETVLTFRLQHAVTIS